MVILHVKRSAARDEFLFETSCSVSVDSLTSELCEVHNKRIKVLRLAAAVKALAAHGPIRPEETRGLTDEIAKLSDLNVNAYGASTNPDQYGQRTGATPAKEICDILNRTATDAESAVSANLVAQRKNLNIATISEQLDLLRGAVMIAYPAYHRLPSYDPARIELENKEELDGQSESQDALEPREASLWWAAKEMQRGQLLADYIGKNEKTKVVLRLQPRASGAPVREPRIDEETHKAMLSFYYKKQEEAKQLKADDDDSYLASEWANPKGLKSGLITGGREIGWKMA